LSSVIINPFRFVTDSATPTPVGTVVGWGSTSVPDGWLLLNGQSVSTTTYSELFDVIGYEFGGSGSTFQVPDMTTNTRVVIGVNGTYSYKSIQTTGSTITTTVAQMGSHNISARRINDSAIVGSVGASSDAGFSTTGYDSSSTGGGSSHDNSTLSLSMLFIIKASS